MVTIDPETQRLTDVMEQKLKAWRNIANELNLRNAKGEAPRAEDLEAYSRSDAAFIKAKEEWWNHLTKKRTK